MNKQAKKKPKANSIPNADPSAKTPKRRKNRVPNPVRVAKATSRSELADPTPGTSVVPDRAVVPARGREFRIGKLIVNSENGHQFLATITAPTVLMLGKCTVDALHGGFVDAWIWLANAGQSAVMGGYAVGTWVLKAEIHAATQIQKIWTLALAFAIISLGVIGLLKDIEKYKEDHWKNGAVNTNTGPAS